MNQTIYTFGEKVFCTFCGNELPQGIKFCRRCGTAVSVPQFQQPVPPPPIPPVSSAPPAVKPPAPPAGQPIDQQAQATQGEPIRVIALEKKFALVACLKDLILPGNGFLYAEYMVEGGIVGLLTIPLSILGVLHYIQLWFSDVLAHFTGSGANGGFDTSNSFLTWLLILSATWIFIRFLWLSYCVQEHNKNISKQADVSQLVTFVKTK